jgi:hypothetical protein
MKQQTLAGQGLPIFETSRSHSDTPHLVGHLCTSDQPDAETYTLQYTTLLANNGKRNPQSQQAGGLRPTP